MEPKSEAFKQTAFYKWAQGLPKNMGIDPVDMGDCQMPVDRFKEEQNG